MGFLDGFMRGSGSKQVLNMYKEDEEENENYREKGLANTNSNYGWYKCVKCGKSFRKGDMDIDHIVPKSKGGSNSRENLQCICKHCNRSKQADMSETNSDLRRRRTELRQQDKDDLAMLKNVNKNNKK